MDSTTVAKPSAGKAVGYSHEEAALPEVACADTSMGGYQDVSGREEHIRVLAYRLWEEAGKPDGRDTEFWEQAKRQVGRAVESSDKV